MNRAVALALALLVSPSLARAQGTVSETAAEALFTDGQRLMKAGNYDEACEKFAQSQKLESAVGTQLNLAVCLKRKGQLASSWAAFLDGASSARDAGQKRRAEYATKEAASLEPELGRLVIVPPTTGTSGLWLGSTGRRCQRRYGPQACRSTLESTPWR